MERVVLVLATLGIVAGVVAPASAEVVDPCGENATVTEAGGFYIDHRNGFEGLTEGNVWIYFESNGREGLQRGGSNYLISDVDCMTYETYQGVMYPITPDSLIF